MRGGHGVFYIYFLISDSYFTGSGLKFRTVLYTLHCPAEKAVRTSSEALWADEPLAWHVASPDLLPLERSLEMMVESMALPLNGDDYQFWKFHFWGFAWLTPSSLDHYIEIVIINKGFDSQIKIWNPCLSLDFYRLLCLSAFSQFASMQCNMLLWIRSNEFH